MQVSIETTSGLERRLTVGVPADRVESEVNVRLKDAAPKVKLDGFRPGKVPLRVVRQRFGAGIRQEVIGEVVSQSFQEAVVQEKLRPAGQPTIEPKSLEAGKDLEYIAVFEVFPEISLVEMKDFPIEKPVADVTDEDVDRIIGVFRKQKGEWTVVERAAAKEDTVNIDYTGTKDGEAFEGGSAEGSDLELGSGRMIEGFEAGIEGMKAGDEKTLALTFPESYHNEELQGAAVEFKVKLNSVSEMALAPLDEALFESYGVTEGGEEGFRSEVRENMQRELKNATEGHIKKQVMDAVVEAHSSLEIPKALIAQEVNVLREQMFQQFGGSAPKDLDLNSLLPDDMFSENAKRRVRLGLVLSEMISKFEIKADADRVKALIEEMAATYEDPQEVIDWYNGDSERMGNIESRVLEEQVVEKLMANATITDSPCTYQEAIDRSHADQQAMG